jgi:cytosine/adenosine deaminase-related metal-dependent hydrolase
VIDYHDGLIRPMLAVSVVATHTRETLQAIELAAKRLGCPIQIHIQSGSGRDYDNDPVLRNTGAREVPLLDDLGLLENDVFGAHLLGIDPAADLPLLARKAFTFVHCPTAGGVGANPSSQPYPEALALGINTALGLDAHSGDFVDNLKLAVIEGRSREQLLSPSSPLPLQRPSIWDVVRSATMGAAVGLRRDDLGRITPGARADLCSIDVSGLHVGSGTLPLAPLNHLLYANAHDVRNVMIEGEWKIRERRLLIGDKVEISRRRGVVMANLWDVLAREGVGASSCLAPRTDVS